MQFAKIPHESIIISTLEIKSWYEKQAYKYETPFQGPYGIIQTWTNGTITIQTGVVTDKLHIRHIKPYKGPEIE